MNRFSTCPAACRLALASSIDFTAAALTLASGILTANRFGTRLVTVYVSATSDGTASSQLTYKLFRVELSEKYDQDIEEAAGGERTLWLPLNDSLGWSAATIGGGGAGILEPSNADRSSVKSLGALATFDYHPALSGRGYRSRAQWTNVLLGSDDWNQTGADWTATGSSEPSTTIQSGHV